MAFSDFKQLADVQQQYHIRYQEEKFIPPNEFKPADYFINELEFHRKNIDVYASEASRCEIIISPILREIYKKYYLVYSFWIQKSIRYDDHLVGTPDYLFTKKSILGKTVLETPLCCIVEAKKNDFDQGWGQCLAELIAAQKMNQENNCKEVYGVVTDGDLWQFGKLLAEIFTKNSENYTVDNLPRLLGALDFILQEAAKHT